MDCTIFVVKTKALISCADTQIPRSLSAPVFNTSHIMWHKIGAELYGIGV